MIVSRSILALVAILIWSQSGVAQEVTATRPLAAGVVYTEYTTAGPNIVHVIEIELLAAPVRLESFRARGLVRTTEQVKHNVARGKRVLAAINADFFSFLTGWPVGNQIENGQFVLGTPSVRSHVALDANNKPYFERLSFRGALLTPQGDALNLVGVNRPAAEGGYVLHTSFRDSGGVPIGAHSGWYLRLLEHTWLAGDTVRFVVTSSQTKDTLALRWNEAFLIPPTGADESTRPPLPAVGDTMMAILGFDRPLRSITQVLGGAGRILLNGVLDTLEAVASENIPSDFLTRRHPRTFVAFDRDTTRIALCVVDGRQEQSVGMSFLEMAEFLLSIGMWNAVNLDGGGSSTMVIDGVIVNSPSDRTGERAVANTLQVILDSETPLKGK